MISTYGFSIARITRAVISSRDCVKWEWTEATVRSNPARKSPSQSTSPSGSMFSSVPWSSVIFGYFAWSFPTRARCANVFSSVIRCM